MVYIFTKFFLVHLKYCSMIVDKLVEDRAVRRQIYARMRLAQFGAIVHRTLGSGSNPPV